MSSQEIPAEVPSLSRLPTLNLPTRLEKRETPSSDDLLRIKNLASSARDDLCDVLRRLARSRDEVLVLERKDSSLREALHQCNLTISPIFQLPNEILGMIVSYVIEEKWITNGSATHLPTIACLQLVCTRWRDLALSTPSFWSAISLDLTLATGVEDQPGCDRMQCLQVAVGSFLARSKTSLLSVRLRIKNDSSLRDSTMFTLLASHSERWKSFELRVSGDAVFDSELLSGLADKMPQLKKVRLVSDHPCSPTGDFAVFDSAPRLESWHVDGFLKDSRLLVPPSQLTELSIVASSATAVLETLPKFPHLCSLRLRFNTNWVSGGEKKLSANVVLNSLQFLELSLYDPYNGLYRTYGGEKLERIFRYLRTPSLHSLTVLYHCPESWHVDLFEIFLRCSRCSLTFLRMEGTSGIINTLACVHTLRTLIYVDWDHGDKCKRVPFTSDFVDCLNQRWFLPRLEYVDFCVKFFKRDFAEKEIADAVFLRATRGPLRFFRLRKRHRTLYESSYELLHAIPKKGFHAEISSTKTGEYLCTCCQPAGVKQPEEPLKGQEICWGDEDREYAEPEGQSDEFLSEFETLYDSKFH